MYLIMAFVGCIIFPLAVMPKGIQLKNPPFRVVVVGTIFAAGGALLAIGMGSVAGIDMSGGETIDQMVKNITENDAALKQLGLTELSGEAQKEQLTNYYKEVFKLLPTAFFVFGAIVSYLEYGMLARRRIKKGKEAILMPPINEFNLDRSALTGWCLTFLTAWLLARGEVQYADVVYTNIFALFEYAFAVQGVSLIFHHAKLKRIRKVFPVLLCVCMFFFRSGAFILCIFGFIDVAFGLKGRIRGR